MPQGAEMLFWEWQSWETGGGRNRLTIWKDGRSQIAVVPDAYTRGHPERFHPRQGWIIVEKRSGLFFLLEPALPEDIAREKFQKAFEAGIHLLEPFRPDYVDGSGTLVGIQINGELKEIVIPMFLDNNQGTRNHKRFLAVSEILAQFDVNAYDMTK
ncbi:MAG: hypothetical protein ACE5K9_07865 [Candidatus Methylomirabilales bacterium]